MRQGQQAQDGLVRITQQALALGPWPRVRGPKEEGVGLWALIGGFACEGCPWRAVPCLSYLWEVGDSGGWPSRSARLRYSGVKILKTKSMVNKVWTISGPCSIPVIDLVIFITSFILK